MKTLLKFRLIFWIQKALRRHKISSKNISQMDS